MRQCEAGYYGMKLRTRPSVVEMFLVLFGTRSLTAQVFKFNLEASF